MKPVIRWSRWQTPVMLMLALATGVLAVLGTRAYVANRIAGEQPVRSASVSVRDIVVAKNDLAVGEVLRERHLASRSVPSEFVTASAVPANQHEQLLGRTLAQPVSAGDPVVLAALEAVETASVSQQIPPGTRAMSIQVDEVNSISGMLQPGDRIDLYVSLKHPLPSAQSPSTLGDIAAPLLERVQVLATGRSLRVVTSERGNRPMGVITVAVSIEQAQKLMVAQRSGRLTALLRARDDLSPASARPMDLSQALNVRPVPPAAAARMLPEVIVGGRGTVLSTATQPLPPLNRSRLEAEHGVAR